MTAKVKAAAKVKAPATATATVKAKAPAKGKAAPVAAVPASAAPAAGPKGKAKPARTRKAILAEVKTLAQKQGFVTEEQIDQHLGEDFDEHTSDVMEDVFVMLTDLNLPV
jgi:hypothetical protein